MDEDRLPIFYAFRKKRAFEPFKGLVLQMEAPCHTWRVSSEVLKISNQDINIMFHSRPTVSPLTSHQ